MGVLGEISTRELWHFSSDVGWRKKYFCIESFRHPAKLHLGLLQYLIDRYTLPGETLFDPMAGIGSLMLAAAWQRNVILRELEPSYVQLIAQSIPFIRRAAGLFIGQIDYGVADARQVIPPPFDHIITSPPYGFETGNRITAARRMAQLTDGGLERRLGNLTGITYSGGFRYDGGSQNIGNKSGRAYWREMRIVYARYVLLLPPGGLLIVILKNHYRRGILIEVVGQTVSEVTQLGLSLVERHGRLIDKPSHWQRRRKELGFPIVDTEEILIFRKGANP